MPKPLKNASARHPKSAATCANSENTSHRYLSFSAGPLHDRLQKFAADHSLRPGDLFPALRLCITGRQQGADMFRTLELLGRDRVLRRIDLALTGL
ncbi:MAG UNVERIFIED_CONTAM: hypothetical protein LVR18_41885 [Planctomycetaceae bacterium]